MKMVPTEENEAKNNNNDVSITKPNLKRVSFGSSKGSMVETLIYEDPIPENELAYTNYYHANITRYGTNHTSLSSKISPVEHRNGSLPTSDVGVPNTRKDSVPLKPTSKVRVTFFDSIKPDVVTSPDLEGVVFNIPNMGSPSPTQDGPDFIRQHSGENEFDNPFRPDSDLSKEADQIVQLIKAGKPITTPVDEELPRIPSPEHEHVIIPQEVVPNETTPTKPTSNNVSPKTSPSNGGKIGANGNTPASGNDITVVESVEIQHGVVVPPSDASQVERVVVKKKPKSECCVMM